jgi:hypothetical protein
LVMPALNFSQARQDDTDLIRTWEVPGTAHADAYNLGIGDTDDGSGRADTLLFNSMVTPPKSIYGGIIKCDLPINAGPHGYVLRSAVASLDEWITTRTPPPKMPRIELDANGGLVVDDVGNARGGIRTPHLDAPIATLTGTGQTGASFCRLFGTTTPFTAAALAKTYPDHQSFVTKWNAAVESAVAAGAVLPPEAEHLKAAAQASAIGGSG